MKEAKVFSLRVVRELTKRGFEPIATEPNTRDLKLKVFVYEKTPQFEKAFDEILTSFGNEK